MRYGNIREAEIINHIKDDWFGNFDCTAIIKDIDFSVKLIRENDAFIFDDEYLLWAEAKKGSEDTHIMLAQLILTIGKARTFDKIMPPKFLGAFDSEKIVFVPYFEMQDIFYLNDFNWNVAPSNHETREFQLIKAKIETVLNGAPQQTFLFYFEKDKKELRRFIKENFVVGKGDITKIRIDKNNFKIIFNKWAESVMPTIAVDWEKAKKNGIIAGDFYLADLLSENNKTLKEKLFVLLQNNFYGIDRHLNEMEFFTSSRVEFKDKQKAHNAFWAKYERPPQEDYWDFIINRRDLLVPPDVRERKGSFFTPRQCVELSQQYLADVFGENWQEEYYVWDCCAGTGNLLEGLTDKYRIFASTLDKQDVFVMHDRIKNGANLLENHVFQFDFLNDDFTKLPESLQKIINDEKLRKKLIIYINPPYAEATNYKGNTKSNVAKQNKIFEKYKTELDGAMNELFAQFFIRIYKELPESKLAAFSKIKYITAPNFKKFRANFKVKYLKGFVSNAAIFDNVKGNFPIGFLIYDLKKDKEIEKILCDVYENESGKSKFIGTKTFYSNNNNRYLNEWIISYKNNSENIGYLNCANNSFQNQKFVWISIDEQNTHCTHLPVVVQNIIPACVYFAVRHCINATWLNDRDQFLFPNKKWEKDLEFKNDCLAFTLFHGQNRISVKDGVNHWIPFTEVEIDAPERFESHFISSFISGKIIQNGFTDLFDTEEKTLVKREFSPEAQAVFDAGREIWKYYHKAPLNPPTGGKRSSPCGGCWEGAYNVNASLYDIKEFFKGRDDKGKMNNRSQDEEFNRLEQILSEKLKILAAKIEPKVYECEFLLK